MKNALLGAVAAAILFLALGTHQARALATRGVRPKHAEVVCTGTAAPIIPATADYLFSAWKCVNEHTTEIVYIGDSTVTTSTYGTKICATSATCIDGASAGADGVGEYCVSDGTSVTLHCRFYY